MSKRFTAVPIPFYQKWPVWLLVPVTLVMVEVFFHLGSFVYFALLGLGAGIYVSITQRFDLFASGTIPLHLELLSFAGVALVVFAWSKWVEKRSLQSLGFFNDHWAKELALGFGLGALQFSLSIGLVWLFGGVELSKVDFSTATLVYILSVIPFWLLQGGTEELVTRGWLLPILSHRIGVAWAVGLSSVIFGLIHLGNDNVTFLSVLNIILSGFTMALYFLKRDNIWSVVGLHGAWNFFQGNIYGVAVSGSEAGASLLHFTTKTGAADWISGGAFGTEGSLMASLVELLFMAYFAYSLMAERKKQ